MQLGGYEVGEELGRGGMARVFRARDPQGAEVALKVVNLKAAQVDPDLVARFLVEVRAAGRLRHPAIVRVFDAGRADGQAYMAMELLSGGALDTRLREGPLPIEQAVAIASRVARALAAAHDQGVLHRDLKPANVLLDGEGQAYVADFGLARILDATRMTQTGEVLGTPNYMAPEQALGEPGRVGPRTDVYGLGATLYALLTGHPPFPGRSLVEVMTAVVNDPPPPLRSTRPEVDPRLESIVLHCLAKEPAQRPESMQALGDELDHWLQGEASSAERSSASTARAAVAAALVTLIGLAAALGVLWAARGGPPPPPPATPGPDDPTSEAAGAPGGLDLGVTLRAVETLLAQHDLPGASSLLNRIAPSVGPTTPLAVAADFHYLRGLVLMRNGELSAARAALDAGLERAPDRPAMHLYRASAIYFSLVEELGLADPEAVAARAAARESFQPVREGIARCLELREDFAAAYLLRALVALATNEEVQARADLDRFLEFPEGDTPLTPDHAEDRALAYFRRATLRRDADPEGALADLAEAATHPRRRFLALDEASMIHGRRFELARAEELLDQLIHLSGGSAYFFQRRGRVRLQAGKRRQAGEDFEQAVARGREQAASWVTETANRSRAVTELSRLAQAQDYQGLLDQVQAWPPLDDPHVRFFSARARLELGHAKHDEALIESSLEEFDAALRAIPDDPHFLSELGRALHRLRRSHGATAAQLAALTHCQPQARASVLYNLGLALLLARDGREAAEAFGQMLEAPGLSPGLRSRVQASLARSLRVAGDFDRAIQVATPLLKSPATRDGAELELALARFELGDDDQAQATLGGLVSRFELSPDPVVYSSALPVLLALGQPKSVLTAGATLLERREVVGATRRLVLLTRCRAALALGHTAEALADAERAVELNPGFAGPLLVRAVCRLQLGQRDAARADAASALGAWEFEPLWDSQRRERVWARAWLSDLERVAELAPEHPAYPRWRANLHSFLGEHAEAEALLSDAIEASQDTELVLQRGWARSRAGVDSGATADLALAMDQPVRRALAGLLLADHHRRQGRTDGAKQLLESLLAALSTDHAIRPRVEHELRRLRGELTPWR